MKFPWFTEWRAQKTLTAEQLTDETEIGVVKNNRSYRTTLAFLRVFIGEITAAIGDVLLYSPQELTAVQRRQARTNLRAASDLRAGRTLGANSAIVLNDYGTVVSLAGFQLTPPITANALAGGVLAAQGPGSVSTSAHGVVTIEANESAVVHCIVDGDTRVLAINRLRPPKQFITDGTAPSGMMTGDHWFDTSINARFIWLGTVWVEDVTQITTGYVSIVNASGIAYNIPATNSGCYIRKANPSGIGHTATIKLQDGGTFAYPANFVIKIKNVADTGDLTLVAEGIVTFRYASGRNVIAPGDAREIVRTGLNSFDIN